LAESTFHVKHSAHLTFPLPASPHLAARAAGEAITLAPIVAIAAGLRRDSDVVLELAGGLFTPLADGLLNVDLVLALAPDRHLMVVPDRLGALHDALAATTAAVARGATPDALLVSQGSSCTPNLGNTVELRRYLAMPILGPLRYGGIASRAEQLASILGIERRPV
jgi:dethiobiotin synthetase